MNYFNQVLDLFNYGDLVAIGNGAQRWRLIAKPATQDEKATITRWDQKTARMQTRQISIFRLTKVID